MEKEAADCATACLETRKTALQTLRHRLRRDGLAGGPETLLRLLDCAQACETCAEGCGRGDPHAAPVAEACARSCEAAAADCERDADVQLRQCAEVCRYCAHLCYRVVNAVPA
jgi:hypothetical protein